MQEFLNQYKDELLRKVIPFWMAHSRDDEYGGYLTSLDRDGTVFDTDKWMWLQGREIWTFATLYTKVERRPEWLAMALHGADFIRRFGTDGNGDFYFGLTRDGKPLVQPYNIFSDCFCCMGLVALDAAQPGSGYGAEAKKIFQRILDRRDNPKGKYNKLYPGTRPLKSFSLPMILCNLALEMEPVLGSEYVNRLVRDLAAEIMRDYYKEEFGCVLENVAPDGSFVDSFEGRTLSPGHGIEAMWFLMDIGERLGDTGLIRRAADITLQTLEKGWDREFGGIFYFLDVKGKYPLQLEWDQKLWWVHLESLVACCKGFLHTGDGRLEEWFRQIHGYTWDHFADPEYPEWYGYLSRHGNTLFPFKGGKWKGCFHLPRALLQIWRTLEKM
ncbi:AGE family epimerase/isomerase [Breznakiella homolactica]|uniref:AGE family epimerase/isomerase n=1 Tax=Breznakiella homolactica TaxID=2798577 RepID=A0A7T7XQC5_9SPIR|nr:AGE family epimerase/isomerase [Breznakiella homolactica]QQO10576.1 AGE family epimerase/isomerase [Breznakiella homolactica]